MIDPIDHPKEWMPRSVCVGCACHAVAVLWIPHRRPPLPLPSKTAVPPVPFFLFSYFATQHQDALELEGPDPSLGHFIVTRGEDMWLKMVLNDGLLHADLHPVNTRASSWVWFGFPPA